MKKLVLITLIIYPFFIKAQKEPETILSSETDSILHSIIRGREQLIQNFLFGYFTEAQKIYQEFKKEYGQKYVILRPNEEVSFHLAARNFKQFLKCAKNYGPLPPEKIPLPDSCNFEADLNSYIIAENEQVKSDLDTSKLQKYEKELIGIYLDSFDGHNPIETNKKIETFKSLYQGNGYSGFLNSLKTETEKYSATINLSVGHNFLNGPLTNYYSKDNFSIIQMEIDGFIKRFYLSFNFGGNIGPIRSTQDMPVKNFDLVHKEGENAGNLKIGFKTGYVVWQNNLFSIYPYASFGIFNMLSNSPEFDNSEDDEEMYILSNSFFSGFGVASDITLKRWQTRENNEPDISLYIRPCIGYDYFLSKKQNAEGRCFSLSIAIGASCDIIKKKRLPQQATL